jgi:hypothetical protein
MLYPLSYEGARAQLTASGYQRLTGRARAYQPVLRAAWPTDGASNRQPPGRGRTDRFEC